MSILNFQCSEVKSFYLHIDRLFIFGRVRTEVKAKVKSSQTLMFVYLG